MEYIEGAKFSCLCCYSYIQKILDFEFFFEDAITIPAYWCEQFLTQGADGVLVPGGFGDRGVQGKILAAKYARENKIPFLGICLGMQIAVIEYARSVMNLKDANSTEFDQSTKNPCVIFMPEVESSLWTPFKKLVFRYIIHISLQSCQRIFIQRVRKLIWGLQWDSGQGGHTSRLKTARPQSCEDTSIELVSFDVYFLIEVIA